MVINQKIISAFYGHVKPVREVRVDTESFDRALGKMCNVIHLLFDDVQNPLDLSVSENLPPDVLDFLQTVLLREFPALLSSQDSDVALDTIVSRYIPDSQLPEALRQQITNFVDAAKQEQQSTDENTSQ